MKALNRLIYTISNQHKPNQADADALNEIIKYVNQEKERQLNNHHLFAKMYISTFKNELIKTDSSYQMIADSLRMTLKTPLEVIYDNFITEINQKEFEKLCKKLGVVQKLPYLRTDEEDEINRKIIKENSQTLSEVLSHYDKEKMTHRLNELLTKLVEDYG